MHPDPFYKIHSSTEEYQSCHRSKGVAGTYGAEGSSCDTPISLINATFTWIEENLKDEIDFIVWTGDTARHDNDEKLPRTQKSVYKSNQQVVDRFTDIFRNPNNANGSNELVIPIIPNLGNNDLLPHNILKKGPNKVLKKFSKIWNQYIPDDQMKGFQKGGWFWVEVIPDKLAVFSLNTMYFFESNYAAKGCSKKKQPGYKHFEWLRDELQIMRERGMKVILSGHVPPAKTSSKMNWEPSCWEKYVIWSDRFRDVIVGSVYGYVQTLNSVKRNANADSIPAT